MPSASGRRENAANRVINGLDRFFGRLWDRSHKQRLADWEKESPSLGKEVSDITKEGVSVFHGMSWPMAKDYLYP